MTIFRKTKPPTLRPADVYAAISTRSRQVVFYTDYQVPDTPSGRFEVLALHLALILRCLKLSNQPDLSQDLCNWVVADIEESLRIMPVRELKISRRLKEFIEGFYGRLVAYDKALELNDQDMLKLIISRNVYGGIEGMEEKQLNGLASYAIQTWEQLQLSGVDDVIPLWKESL